MRNMSARLFSLADLVHLIRPAVREVSMRVLSQDARSEEVKPTGEVGRSGHGATSDRHESPESGPIEALSEDVGFGHATVG